MMKPQNNSKIKAIAFYLPQFHPIPENDQWWGEGFTEWINVRKAKPLFKGHHQPHESSELGYYDLRDPLVREKQAALAREAGIFGFCYYHYWFHGKQLLEHPFNEVLATGKPDFPFCLCWANESWSRRWLGEETNILQKQTYSHEDDLAHIEWLKKTFSDKRYITIEGRPLFLIYRPKDLPTPERTFDVFKKGCLQAGLPEPYILGVDAYCAGFDLRKSGCDGTLVFEPQLGVLPGYMSDGMTPAKFIRNCKLGVLNPKLKIYDYSQARNLMMKYRRHFPTVPCILVGWDNTSRRGNNAIILIHSTPKAFESGLSSIVRSLSEKPEEERLVFINAWNEWGEGNHLEPCAKWGRSYLEATGRALSSG